MLKEQVDNGVTRLHACPSCAQCGWQLAAGCHAHVYVGCMTCTAWAAGWWPTHPTSPTAGATGRHMCAIRCGWGMCWHSLCGSTALTQCCRSCTCATSTCLNLQHLVQKWMPPLPFFSPPPSLTLCCGFHSALLPLPLSLSCVCVLWCVTLAVLSLVGMQEANSTNQDQHSCHTLSAVLGCCPHSPLLLPWPSLS